MTKPSVETCLRLLKEANDNLTALRAMTAKLLKLRDAAGDVLINASMMGNGTFYCRTPDMEKMHKAMEECRGL